MSNPLCLENSFGNLARVLSVFNEEKIQEKIRGRGTCNFRMQKILIWRCQCLQFRIYGRDFKFLLSMNFLGKRQSH